MTIEDRIMQALPGTGAEISNKVNHALAAANDGQRVTPSTVYAVLMKRPYSKLVKRTFIANSVGSLVNHFEVR